MHTLSWTEFLHIPYIFTYKSNTIWIKSKIVLSAESLTVLKVISSPYCAVSVLNVCEPHKHCNANRSYSLRTAYLIFEAHFKFFFQQFPWVLQLWRFFIKWYQKEWSIKLRIDNGGWHETFNLLHVSRCEMLHFVTSYMKQIKNPKQTLDSAQKRRHYRGDFQPVLGLKPRLKTTNRFNFELETTFSR